MTEVAELGYEEARDALVEVVRRLEAGGATLEESLALWERGEALATRCEQWLAGARARVAALSPAATLERGYAVVQRADGALVRDPAEVADDERLQVRVAGGRLPVRVARQDGTP